ncbi:MAG: type IV secretion system DNA-binding domain-containing protein [Pseudomonadota bacterium]
MVNKRPSYMADPFSRGLDIIRLQVGIQARALRLYILWVAGAGLACAFLYLYLTCEMVEVINAPIYWVYFLLIQNGIEIAEVPFVSADFDIKMHAHQTYFASKGVQALAAVMKARMITAFLIFLGTVVVSIFLFWWIARARGESSYGDLIARGEALVDGRTLAKLIRRKGPVSQIAINDVRLPEQALNRHIFIAGSTRSGKSLNIKRATSVIRERREMAIIYDKVGDYIAEFYDPERGDLLFNPADARSPKWSPWCEGTTPMDLRRIANSLIPAPADSKNVYFHEAARSLFVSLLNRVGREQDRSIARLLEIAYSWPAQEKGLYLRGTESAKHFEGSDAGRDVDSTMAVFIKALMLLPIGSGGSEDRSIREFIRRSAAIQDEGGKGLVEIERAQFERHSQMIAEARRGYNEHGYHWAWRNYAGFLDGVSLLPEDLEIPTSNPTMLAGWQMQHRDLVHQFWEQQDKRLEAEYARKAAKLEVEGDRMQKQGRAPWLFIGTSTEHLDASRPLIATWLDIAATTLLSLQPREDRRIWFVLDEWHTLQRLVRLQDLLAEGAKYGVCVLAGTQNIGQLRANYGRDQAEVMLSLFNTKGILRMPEPDTAQWGSRLMGDLVWDKSNESIRYGTSETMDGASLQSSRVVEAKVMPNDIMSLPDLEGYVMVTGGYPAARTKTRFQPKLDQRPRIAVPYQHASFDNLVFSQVEGAMAQGDGLFPSMIQKAMAAQAAPIGDVPGAFETLEEPDGVHDDGSDQSGEADRAEDEPVDAGPAGDAVRAPIQLSEDLLPLFGQPEEKADKCSSGSEKACDETDCADADEVEDDRRGAGEAPVDVPASRLARGFKMPRPKTRGANRPEGVEDPDLVAFDGDEDFSSCDTDEQRERRNTRIRELVEAGDGIPSICKRLGVSRSTVYRILKDD